MKPLNKQDALDSGARAFYVRYFETGKWMVKPVNWLWQMSKRGDVDDYEFLPIPTPEQLLGAVKGKCHACTDLSSRVVIMGDPVMEPGDEVIIIRKVNNPTAPAMDDAGEGAKEEER